MASTKSNTVVDIFSQLDEERVRAANSPIRSTIKETFRTASTTLRIIRREVESYEDEQVIELARKRTALLAQGL